MKNLNAKHALYLILAVVSIFCYVYVNTQQPAIDKNDAVLGNSGYVQTDEFEEDEKVTPFIDIRLIQKAVETGKNLIPTN
ncbi:MAG: hypothetical protein DWQ02_09945 [Bacteroidetes bacterium]|nr:MAG: hypothetical protein DWQ02_09945 [Bacteroidota bacterium]